MTTLIGLAPFFLIYLNRQHGIGENALDWILTSLIYLLCVFEQIIALLLVLGSSSWKIV